MTTKARVRVAAVCLLMAAPFAGAADAVTDLAYRKAIAEAVEVENCTMPSSDGRYRFDGVTFDGSTVRYDVTLHGLVSALARTRDDDERMFQGENRRSLCASAPNINAMKAGATYRYVYHDINGGVFADVTITGEDCLRELGLPQTRWPVGMSRRPVAR